MLGSAEDEGLFEGYLRLLVIDIIPFPVPEDLSALVAHDQLEDNFAPMPTLEGEVVTLTHLPRSRWQTLLNLDVIQVSFYAVFCIPYTPLTLDYQQRNKPKEPPKAPEKAPFFLPTLAGADARFVVQEKEKEKTSAKKSQKTVAESVFFQKLSQELEDSNCGCTVFLGGSRAYTSARRSVLRLHQVTIPCNSRSGDSLFSDCSRFESFPACPFAAFKVSS
jgi:hypothetical protein